MKYELMWLIFFLLLASTAGWLPGAVNRQCDIALRSSPSLMPWNGDDSIVTTIQNAGPFSMSRRSLFGGTVVSVIGVWCGDYGAISCAPANAYMIDQVEPDERDIYTEAQNIVGPIRVLWVGPGDMVVRSGAAASGVYKNLFKAGSEVIAVDLLKPKFADLRDAEQYATRQGYNLRFQQGDATKLNFQDDTFDVVVSSLFLCQDFDPVVVVSEIRRVLKPGGRFGFYEHVEDIDKVIVGKVFGEASVIKIEAYPEKVNILAGVVRKV